MDSRIHRITIDKIDGKWRVTKPKETVTPGDQLIWQISEEGNTARFQFTNRENEKSEICFVENVPGEQKQIDDDWGAVIEGASQLKLQVRRGVEPGRYYYAVMMFPDNDWAIGENPPPELEIG